MLFCVIGLAAVGLHVFVVWVAGHGIGGGIVPTLKFVEIAIFYLDIGFFLIFLVQAALIYVVTTVRNTKRILRRGQGGADEKHI